MKPKSFKHKWPGRVPAKGTKSRAILLKALHGVTAKELLEAGLIKKTSDMSTFRGVMLDQKGIVLEHIAGVWLLTSFLRSRRRREAPGVERRLDKLFNP